MRFLLTYLILIGLATPVIAGDWFFDAGVGAAVLQRDNSGMEFDSDVRVGVQFGMHKTVTESLRFGSRVEWLVGSSGDPTDEPHLVFWRLGDIDWRFADDWAFNIGAGFTRFYREQPAYGYGYGVGIKYRLTDAAYLSVELASASVDISTGVPSDSRLGSKDTLGWGSAGITVIF